MQLSEIKELIKYMLSNHEHGMMTIKETITDHRYNVEVNLRIIYTESTKKPITDAIITVHEKVMFFPKTDTENLGVTDDNLKSLYLEVLQDLAIFAVTSWYTLYLKLKS